MWVWPSTYIFLSSSYCRVGEKTPDWMCDHKKGSQETVGLSPPGGVELIGAATEQQAYYSYLYNRFGDGPKSVLSLCVVYFFF